MFVSLNVIVKVYSWVMFGSIWILDIIFEPVIAFLDTLLQVPSSVLELFNLLQVPSIISSLLMIPF